MGWSSGGDIFAPVARKMFSVHVSPWRMVGVLLELHDQLHNQDWDTCDDMLQEFPDDPIIRSVLFMGGCIPCRCWEPGKDHKCEEVAG